MLIFFFIVKKNMIIQKKEISKEKLKIYTVKVNIFKLFNWIYKENDEYDINPETGMRNDGQVLVNSFQNIEERQGIGGQLSESDVKNKNN